MRLFEFFAKDDLCSADGSGLCKGDMTVDSFLSGYFGNIAGVMFSIAAIVCVIMIVVCGFMLMTSAGDPGKVEKAKKGLIGAIIGLLISLFAATIANVIGGVADSIG